MEKTGDERMSMVIWVLIGAALLPVAVGAGKNIRIKQETQRKIHQRCV